MSTLDIAEKAVTDLAPDEFERFLRWLSCQIGARFEGTRESARPSAQERVERFDQRVREGSAVPFEGADMSRWPESARSKAETIVGRWHEEHGK